MRKLVYYVACSVDRFIARTDGSFDFFLTEGQHLADLVASFPETVPGHLRAVIGVTAENRQFDTVLMGRATYEVGLKEGVTSPYPHLKQYLFSRTLKHSPDPDVQLVAGSAVATVRQLKQSPGKDIWLCGGGELATALFPEIDELILKVNPILLGAGIPLFSGRINETVLELSDNKIYGNGFTLLTYQVKHKR
jgi:dihydrofolate reductase